MYHVQASPPIQDNKNLRAQEASRLPPPGAPDVKMPPQGE